MILSNSPFNCSCNGSNIFRRSGHSSCSKLISIQIIELVGLPSNPFDQISNAQGQDIDVAEQHYTLHAVHDLEDKKPIWLRQFQADELVLLSPSQTHCIRETSRHVS